VESVAQEVASFGIGITLVEPGGARTEFRYGSAQIAEKMPEYDKHSCALHCVCWTRRVARPWRPHSHGGRDHRERRPEARPLRMILGTEGSGTRSRCSGSESPASSRRRTSPPRRTSRPVRNRHGVPHTARHPRTSRTARVIIGRSIAGPARPSQAIDPSSDQTPLARPQRDQSRAQRQTSSSPTAGTARSLAAIRVAASTGAESSSRPRIATFALRLAESPTSSRHGRRDRTSVLPPCGSRQCAC
jgi:hypothetical protein